ncbi:MAG: hypothetical protein CMJ89_11685 [Planctomycetes bacterium]|nr:hypothetical protein [Planctomycetota bacterium]
MVRHPPGLRGRPSRGPGRRGWLSGLQPRPGVADPFRRSRLHDAARYGRVDVGARTRALRLRGPGARVDGPGAHQGRGRARGLRLGRGARGVVRQRRARPRARLHAPRAAGPLRGGRRGGSADLHPRAARRARAPGAGGRPRRALSRRGRRGGAHLLGADGVRRRRETLPARFERVAEGLLLAVDERAATYPLTIDPIAQKAYLKASNTGAGDHFGDAVSVSGDTVVVGAFGESSAATGVNGDETDNSALGAGAAYVFVRDAGGWSQQAYLKVSNTDLGDQFGGSVAVSGDTVVVGASGEDSSAIGVNGDQSDNSALSAGAAYVFVRSGGSWSQQAYLKASNTGGVDAFGESVAVSGDTVVVGAWNEESNADGVNGDQSDNSTEGAGAAYVFVREDGTWSQQAYLKASSSGAFDRFGKSLSVSGDTLVVGAWGEDSNATGVNGNESNEDAMDSGAAYVFVRNDKIWSQEAYLKASNTGREDVFGWSVSVSGDTVVVGAYREESSATGVNGNQNDNSAIFAGAAYVFVRRGSNPCLEVWCQEAYLKASNTGFLDRFGWSVAVSGDTVVVGAEREYSGATGVDGDQDDNSKPSSGAAYLFVRKDESWSQQAYLKASNTGEADTFGESVAVSGDLVVVGAYAEDSNATGVNGDEGDNSAETAGAAYVFDLAACAPAPATVFLFNGTAINLDTMVASAVQVGGAWTATLTPQPARAAGPWVILLRTNDAGLVLDAGLALFGVPAGLSELLVGAGFIANFFPAPHLGGGVPSSFSVAVPATCALVGMPWFAQSLVLGDLAAGGGALDPWFSSAAGGIVGTSP